MKTYRRSLAERLTNLTLAVLFAVLAAVLTAFAGPFWISYGAWACAVSLALAAVFAFRWAASHDSVSWVEDEAGDRIVWRVWWRQRSLAVAALTEVRVVPCDLQTRLSAGKVRLVLSHKFLRFEDLLDRLRLSRPDLFPSPGDSLRLRTTPVGMLSLLIFAAGTAGAGALLGTWVAWLAPLFFVVALVPLVRIVFFYPLEYRVVPGKVIVRYLARKRILETRHLRAQRQDAYAAAGAVFFLLRLEFPGQNIVLDEGHLRDPLRSVVGWLQASLI
jgi:hypothetical protein